MGRWNFRRVNAALTDCGHSRRTDGSSGGKALDFRAERERRPSHPGDNSPPNPTQTNPNIVRWVMPSDRATTVGRSPDRTQRTARSLRASSVW